jgi:two-component system sensor kinase FixL
MKRLWELIDTTQSIEPAGVGANLKAQLLAMAAAATVMAAEVLLRPILGSSTYLLGVLALLLAAGLGGIAATFTTTVLLAVGGVFADSADGLPMLERGGRLGLFLLLAMVISAGAWRLRRDRLYLEQRQTEQRQREALLESSLEAVADGIVVIDGAGLIQSFSAAAERLFGWSADEVTGENVKLLMPPSYAGRHDGYIAHYLATGERRVIGSYRQVTGRRKDGSEFPIELRIGEVKSGERSLFTGMVRDLSGFQQAQRRSEELHAELTHVWSLNSLGEMASVLSHELNQPLSAVANYMRAARNLITRLELDDDDLLDAVSRAGEQAVRAGEIIRTMRDLATRGGMQQRPESLSAIISEIDFMVSLLARDAKVQVFYDLDKCDDIVMADRIQLQQLLVNLVRNAIEAVAKYPIRRVNIITKLNSEDELVTTVEDSGPGIDLSVADRLFQPLSSTKAQGMGLGLSICAAIVESHRGRIWVGPSSLGGAAFCFSLARAKNHAEASACQ